jgi:dihydroorotase
MAPPLRSARDVDAIAEALADGTIDAIVTDHAPHDAASKHMDRLEKLFNGSREPERLSSADAAILAEAANGIIGLETALGLALNLVHRGLLDPSRVVALMSSNPARLLRCSGGTLAPGSPADITVIDSALQWTVEPDAFRSLSRNTPFGGIQLKGVAVITIVAGRVAYAREPYQLNRRAD